MDNNSDEALVEYLIEQAYLNSYHVIVHGVLPTEIMDSETPMFAHSVMEGADIGDVNKLIDYFEGKEDYEKCHELLMVREDMDGFPTANHLGMQI